jgi:excisionase family DNA binding protein
MENASKTDERMYTVQEAAKAAGCSEALIHKWKREKKIRFTRDASGRILINADDIDGLDPSADSLLEQTTSQLQALFKTRSAAVDDLKTIIGELRSEQLRKDARISELENRVSEYHAREAKILKDVEELTTMRHDRDLEIAEFQRSQDRKDMAIQKLAPFASAIAARLGLKLPGGAKGPAFTGPAAAAIADIRDSLTAEETDALMSILGPERSFALMTIFDAMPGGVKEKPAKEPGGNGEAPKKTEAA